MNNFLTGKWRVANEVIDNVLARLDTANLDMGEYVRIIANDHPATSKMDTSLINSFISSNWYSGADSSNIQIFIATENLHTMAESIFYHCMETPTGKKSVLGRLLLDHKRISRLDDLIDGLKQTYKARQIYIDSSESIILTSHFLHCFLSLSNFCIYTSILKFGVLA